jgi:hypothetical protein
MRIALKSAMESGKCKYNHLRFFLNLLCNLTFDTTTGIQKDGTNKKINVAFFHSSTLVVLQVIDNWEKSAGAESNVPFLRPENGDSSGRKDTEKRNPAQTVLIIDHHTGGMGIGKKPKKHDSI